MTSIVEVIQHYQRSIDSSQDNEARLLHCIDKLYKLPIKVEHLQETGVGKTVNSLRKFNGEIGVAAKTLVTKWKAMVAAEEEPMDTTSQTNESEMHNDSNGDDGGTTPHEDEDDENHNRNNNTSQPNEHNSSSKHRREEKKDKHKDRHKDRSSSSSNGNKEHKHSSSSSSSLHQQNSEKSSKHSNEKHKSSSSTSASSSKDKESHHKSSSSSSHKDKEREKEKTDHKTSKDKHKEREHDKEKERSDKKRDDKSKTDKEPKSDSPSNTHSSQHKSSSHSSSSKSKHEDKQSHSSSKDKERSDKHKSSSKDKTRTKDEKSSSQSSSKDKTEHKSSSTSSTSKSSTKDPDSAERKRRHNSDNDSNDFKSPQSKVAKVHKSSSSSTTSTPASKAETSPPLHAAGEEEVADDSFDSSMGANFDDVLGMLNVPLKKSKKSTKSPSTPANSSSSSSTIKKDTATPHRPTTSSSSSSSSSGGKVNGTRIAFTTNPSSYSMPSTSKASTMKPDLLAPSAKLEPLDPSIALELPTISTNYKPMPLNQTVMDCVFNNSAASSNRPVRTLTDAEAITHGISSKTMRTKIYSGVRTGQTYQVPSLFDMCIRILQKNIDALEYTGGVPFEVLKPVLERASPQQLYVFEEYNPYLMEDSDVLWQQHVSRNYRTKKRLENESWREMFIRCQEEDERRLSVLKDSIKASQKIAAAPVRKTQLAFVDSMVKPPRNIQKRQEQYGTKAKMVATPAARVASLSSVTPNAAKTGDQRLRVAPLVRDHAQVSSTIRNKKAPLMQKTLQFIRGRHKR